MRFGIVVKHPRRAVPIPQVRANINVIDVVYVIHTNTQMMANVSINISLYAKLIT